MTAQLRQPPGDAVRASSTAAQAGRALAIAAAIGAFLAFIGAFGTDRLPMAPRMIFMVLLSWAGAGLGVGTYRLAARIPGLAGRRWLTGVVSGVIMTAPMTLIVFYGVQIASAHEMPLRALPGFLFTSLVTSIALTLLSLAIANRGAPQAAAAAEPAAPKFLDRLPLKLRGAEVWAVEAEDHYLRLHTSRGQDLILMRLADAVLELDGIEGAQVHRSWWVAREAIADARRGDGRATLTLKDGSEVPVSRTYAKLLRERNWI